VIRDILTVVKASMTTSLALRRAYLIALVEIVLFFYPVDRVDNCQLQSYLTLKRSSLIAVMMIVIPLFLFLFREHRSVIAWVAISLAFRRVSR